MAACTLQLIPYNDFILIVLKWDRRKILHDEISRDDNDDVGTVQIQVQLIAVNDVDIKNEVIDIQVALLLVRKLLITGTKPVITNHRIMTFKI